MLTVLRKYQKSIFLVVTVMVIASFVFFGVSSSIRGHVQEKDVRYGTLYDGTPVWGRQVTQMVRFLSSDVDDLMIFERRGLPNLLNDGVLQNDIIETGIAHELYNRFEGVLKEEIGEKYAKFRSYSPYIHPQKIIGVEAVWGQFGGELPLASFWETFKALGAEMSADVFDSLTNLYVAQKKFPPGFVRQMLLYQQHQYGGMIQADPYLQNGDLALFNAKNAKDWFGAHFLELAALYIQNGAIQAKKYGYQVSLDEARASLVENAMRGFRVLEPNKELSKEDFARFMQHQLAVLHMEEDEAVELWQKVLLVRRWMNEVGHAVFVDSKFYNEYSDSVCKGAEIEVVKLPDDLRFNSIDDLLKFEVYLEAVSKRDDPLQLPSQFYTIEQMRSRAPELLNKRFILRAVVKEKDEMAIGVSMKESLNWQLDEKNWNGLLEEFPYLSKFVGSTVEDKHEFLLGLLPNQQVEVDAFARRKILETKPEAIQETLANAKTTKQNISIPMVKEGTIWQTISDHKTILGLLEKAPLKDEISLQSDLKSAQRLSCYTEDGKTYYRIRVMDRDDEFQIMSFNDATRNGVLDKLLGERLRAEYAKGKFKGDYDEVLSEVKLASFSSLIKGIEKEMGVDAKSFDSLEKRLIFSKDHRFVRMMNEELEKAKEGRFFPLSVETASLQDKLAPLAPLEQAWLPIKEVIRITKNSIPSGFNEGVFEMADNEWSKVLTGSGEFPYFFLVKSNFVDKMPIKDLLEKGREFLSFEARNKVLSEFFDKLCATNAMNLYSKVHSDSTESEE